MYTARKQRLWCAGTRRAKATAVVCRKQVSRYLQSNDEADDGEVEWRSGVGCAKKVASRMQRVAKAMQMRCNAKNLGKSPRSGCSVQSSLRRRRYKTSANAREKREPQQVLGMLPRVCSAASRQATRLMPWKKR
jgi:hypothetical protein